MDNTLKYNKSLLIVLIAITVAFLCCTFFVNNSQNVAYAISPLSYQGTTEEKLNVDKFLSDEILEYTNEEYNEISYGRNITINYNLYQVSFLKFDTQILGEEKIAGEFINTENLEDFAYKVDVNGTVTVDCYAYDIDKVQIDEHTITVKNDNTAPDSYASVNAMESYVGNVTFDVIIDWREFSDALSGKGQVFFTFDYLNNTLGDTNISEVDVENTDTTTLPIYDNGTLKIFHFDKAGNCFIKEYVFDKFDLVAPPIPRINITPNVNTALTSGYAKEYLVTIEYFEDGQSGNKPLQYYVLNDAIKEYHGSFILKYASNYTIKAFCTDNANNNSESDEKNISWSSFDVYAPIVLNKELKIDLTSNVIASLEIEVSDKESGIANVYLETLSKDFVKGVGENFKVAFNPYSMSGLVFVIYDKVGNTSVEHYVMDYFDNEKLCDKIISYNTKYLELNRALYNDAILAQIETEYGILSTMLMANNSQEGNFYAVMDRIDKLIEGRSELTYEIGSVPIVISTVITYKITESDFDNYKKGDSVKLVLNSATNSEVDYVKLSGYKKGFADYFSLSVFYKESEVQELTNGLEITMNLPIGYYERQFTIINMDTKEVVETTIINNQIVFNCKKSASFALIISGNREITLTNEIKYINLFGKKLDYGTFFGVVFGVIGGAALIIGVIVILRKKR